MFLYLINGIKMINGIKTLLANSESTFFIKGNPVFSNGPKSLPKRLPDGPILCN